MPEASTPCRIGILGSAAIARKVWTAIARSSNACVMAVASRDLAKSQAFVQSCGLNVPMQHAGQPTAVDAVAGYENVIGRPDIDAVYIPLPTGLRKPWVIAAMRAGKHVLMEKPCAASLEDLLEMDQIAQQNDVTWMDGVMFEHSLRLGLLQRAIGDGVLGDLRRMSTHFSFNGGADFGQTNVRSDVALEPHGALGDLGWYCIRLMLHVRGHETGVTKATGAGALPTRVRGQCLWDLKGTPGEFAGTLEFESGWMGDLFCSFRGANQQTATISGSDAYMSVDDFVLPFHGGQTHLEIHHHHLDIDRCRWLHQQRTRRISVDECSHGEANAQEVRMIEAFAKRVLDSNPADRHFEEIALHTQRCLDALRRSDRQGGQWIDLQ